MQVKVPKFIEIEDKIISIGGFGITWRQFLALMLGVGGGYIASRIFIAPVGIPIMIVSVIFGVAIAFGRMNGRPLTIYLASAWRFFYKPTTYVWKRIPSHVTLDTSHETTSKEQDVPQTIADTEAKLAEIAKLLDH